MASTSETDFPTSDNAVEKATGRSWVEWLARLDARGAANLTHPEIVTVVQSEGGASAWWCQTVAVGYERARGFRKVHETSEGYKVSRSKTVNVPVEQLFAYWVDDELRARWLPHELVVTGATEPKSVRAQWPDKTRLRVDLSSLQPGKSRAVVEHRDLGDSADAERRKTFWSEALSRLKAIAEGAD